MELTPDFSVSVDGQFEIPKARILSIRITDQAGEISDSCSIELDDFDNALRCPNTEAKISVFLGYKETGLTKMGTYYVHEIEISGARNKISITADALPKAMRSQKTRTNDMKLKEYLASISSELGLGLSDEYGDIDLSGDAQVGESNMSYLTRLANRVGAVTKPVDNHLVFTENMSGKSASGQNLPAKYIDAFEVSSYSFVSKETEEQGATGTVYATWYDRKKADYFVVQAGSGNPQTELKGYFSSEKEALSAAQARIRRIEKNNKTLDFSLEGRPDLFSSGPIVLREFPTKIPTKWIISKVEHRLDHNGYITRVWCVGGK